MTSQHHNDEYCQKSAPDRLIFAVLAQWPHLGGSGISARKLSETAGVAASAIYHHFGSLERLLVSSQDVARNDAERWLAACLEQLAPAQRAPDLFAGFFAGLIDEWCEAQRQLAFAWREAQLLGARYPIFEEVVQQWESLWSNFWQEALDLFGLGGFAPLVLRVFDNESMLHLFRWRRIADRAALDEFAAGLASWLGAGPVQPTPWRDLARLEALRDTAPLDTPDATTRLILEAAADLVGEAGAANLTHRGVADRTGLTLGVVSHKFRTKSDLVHGAYEAIYTRAAASLHSGEVSISGHDPQAALDGVLSFVSLSQTTGAGDELNVAVARDPALRPFAVQLRYLRGQTSKGLLEALLGGETEVSTLDGAIFSGFLSSQIRRPRAKTATDNSQALRAEFEQLISALRRRDHYHPPVIDSV